MYVAKHHKVQKINEGRAYDPKYAEFRREVRARDGHKCVWPGCTESKPSKLCVHHIRSWAKHPELRYDPDNGVTICKSHHANTISKEEIFVGLFMQIVSRNKRK